MKEELYEKTHNMSVVEIVEMYEVLREAIREAVSRFLMDTSEDSRMECFIIMHEDEFFGLSDMEKPHIHQIWQIPTTGEIYVEYEGDDEPIDFDLFGIEDQMLVLKGLEV